jgi:hypothetical protein
LPPIEKLRNGGVWDIANGIEAMRYQAYFLISGAADWLIIFGRLVSRFMKKPARA